MRSVPSTVKSTTDGHSKTPPCASARVDSRTNDHRARGEESGPDDLAHRDDQTVVLTHPGNEPIPVPSPEADSLMVDGDEVRREQFANCVVLPCSERGPCGETDGELSSVWCAFAHEVALVELGLGVGERVFVEAGRAAHPTGLVDLDRC